MILVPAMSPGDAVPVPPLATGSVPTTWVDRLTPVAVINRLPAVLVTFPVWAGSWAACNVPKAPVERLIGVADKAPVTLL